MKSSKENAIAIGIKRKPDNGAVGMTGDILQSTSLPSSPPSENIARLNHS